MTYRRPLLTAALTAPATLCAAVAASPAQANITAPTVLAGPSASVVEFGNVALASDGSGGAIWRELDRATGKSHIFAARYAAGHWDSPQRVDTALPYDSFEPRIAAAPGGLLVAVFAQDWAHQGDRTLFRLQAAVIKPGARRFEIPFTIDKSVGSDAGIATDVDPDIRLSDAGVGFLTYRVVTDTVLDAGRTPARTGDISATIKVARYAGGTWSGLGTVNRNVGYTVPKPTAGNGPKVSVDRLGNGVVAFLEPDDRGVERVWARRLFSGRLGFVLKASPQDIGGTPLLGDADSFALAGGGLGAATVVSRQLPGPNSPLPGIRLFAASLPNSEQDDAKQFRAPTQLDEAADKLASPAAAMTTAEDSAIAYMAGSTVRTATVGRKGLSAPSTIDGLPATGGPLITLGPAARAVAWPAVRGTDPVVAVSQSITGSPDASASLVGTSRGDISELSLGGSGLGDALVGFRQGSGQDNEIVVAAIQVPPQPFLVTRPDGDWLRPDEGSVTWERPPSGVGGVQYEVFLDGRQVARSLYGVFSQLPADQLDDGVHTVRVRARDAAGQTTLSKPVQLQIDGTPPLARAQVRGRVVTVRVYDRLDGSAGKASGVNQAKTQIAFGDGTIAPQRTVASRRYKRPGRYTVRVQSRDKAGNGTTIRLRVTVR